MIVLDQISKAIKLMDLNKSKMFKNLSEKLNPLWSWADSLSVAPEAVLVALEATAASFINSRTTILGNRSTDYTVGPTIFSAIVGESGSKKSPIINAIAIKPLMEMQKKAKDQYLADYVEYEKELVIWNNLKRKDKGPAPTPIIKRQYTIGDYTPEAIRQLAERNPKILRIFDKLAQKSNNSNSYTVIKGIKPQQLLEGYDGILPDMYRRGKHYPSIKVNQCLLGGIYPVFLSDIMINHDPSGKFAQYNLALLDNKPNYWGRDCDNIVDITNLLIELYNRIDSLPEQHFYLSKEAFRLFVISHNKLEHAKQKELNPVIIFQCKEGSSKILKWALLHHIIDSVMMGETPSQEISKRYIQIAHYRMKYQIDQVKKITRKVDDATSSKLSKIYQLALRKENMTITQRDVKRYRLAKEANEAIAYFNKLAESGYGEILKTSRAIKFVAKPLQEKF